LTTTIKFKRGPAAALPLLLDGEPAFTTDSHQLYVGYGGNNHTIAGGGTPLTQMSITSDAAGLKLVNDAAAPGASRYYGTDAAAARGWHALPVSTREGIWSFSTTTTMADPGSGKLRFNAATPASVTALALSKTTDSGIDASNTLKTLTTGDAIQVQDQSNAANWIRFKLTVPAVNNTSWFQLPVALYEPTSYGGVVPNNNSPVLVAVTAGGGGAGGTGTVTSVGLSAPAGFPVTGSPVTGSGTLAFSSPLTTKGDLFVHSGAAHVRLPVGTNGQVLTADSAQGNGLYWAVPPVSLGDGAACTVLGRAANSIGPRADIALAVGQVLARAPAATIVAGRYLPGEILGQTFNNTDESTTSNTAVALPSGDVITITLTAPSTNLVFLFWVDTYNTAVASAIHGVSIWSGGSQQTSMSWPVTAVNTVYPMIGKFVSSGGAPGTYTYELRFQTNAGTARFLRRMMMIQRGF
jgi:Major tropism determinant N-terminal domain